MNKFKVSEVLKMLKEDGWCLSRHSGTSHRQFKHPIKKGKVTVNGKPGDTLSQELLNSIFKQADGDNPDKKQAMKIKVQVEWADKNFSAGTGEINGAVIATGKTLEDVKNNFKDAFQFHIEGALDDGDPLPEEVVKGKYELIFELAASAMLHLADGLITRSAISKATGINEKQLSHYLTGHRKARPEQSKKIASGIIQISKQIDKLSTIV